MRIITWSILIVIVAISAFFGTFLLQDSIDFFRFREIGGSYIFIPGMIWGIILLVMAFVGVLIFRKTPTGYRYGFFRDIFIGTIIVIIFIFILRLTGIGSYVHSGLVNVAPNISDIIYQASSWNNPEGGRIAGTIMEINTDELVIRSLDGQVWKISTINAKIGSMTEISTNERVRIIGTIESSNVFTAKRILPWFGKGEGKSILKKNFIFSE